MLGGGMVLDREAARSLPGTVELAQEVFGLPARVGYPAKVGGLASEYQSPIYATGGRSGSLRSGIGGCRSL